MSNTPKFIFVQNSGYLPCCLGDISGSVASSFDYIGNLSIADVMAFYWNMETFSIVTSGSGTNANGTTSAAGTFCLNPITSCTPWTTGVSFGGLYDVPSATALSSWPAISIPNERVCCTSSGSQSLWSFLLQNPATTPQGTFNCNITVSSDPSNAGKYRIYYQFIFNYYTSSTLAPSLFFYNPNSPAYPVGTPNTSVIASGLNFTIGGLTFTVNVQEYDPFKLYAHSGIGISGSSSNYTYV